jgi:hypothetical protein
MASLTTSGTYVWSQSAVTIISAALRIAQVIGEEETASGWQLEITLDAFNAMVKAWQASGIHLWCEEEAILFPQAGQIQYQIGATSTDNSCIFTQFVQNALSANAAQGTSSVTLNSAAGIASGYYIGIQLVSGANFWTQANGAPSGNTVPLLAALPSQAVAPAVVFAYPAPLIRPLRVYTGRRYTYSSRIDIPMLAMSRMDYANQPNKTTAGIINQYFFDPQTGPQANAYSSPTALVNLWPNPVDYSSGFRFTAQRPIQDLGNLSNLPDFPVEWNAALKWNLALEIAPQYGTPSEQIDIIAKQAQRWYQMASQWDREPEGIRFGVAMRPGLRRLG